MENNLNNLVKGLLMRQKLQNSKGYAESPEFLPALGLFIFSDGSGHTSSNLLNDDTYRCVCAENCVIHPDK